MKEIIIDQPEIQLIPTDHTSVVPARKKERKGVTPREYRRMLNESALLLGISLGVNIVQGIVIWILQAGPIG